MAVLKRCRITIGTDAGCGVLEKAGAGVAEAIAKIDLMFPFQILCVEKIKS